MRTQAASFADGIVWPREAWRGAGIVLASIVMKLLATTHFLWSGLAFGITLKPGEYLFVIVFLGFLIIIGHFLRMMGGFIVGSIFVLGLFGVGPEPALAMVLRIQGASQRCRRRRTRPVAPGGCAGASAGGCGGGGCRPAVKRLVGSGGSPPQASSSKAEPRPSTPARSWQAWSMV